MARPAVFTDVADLRKAMRRLPPAIRRRVDEALLEAARETARKAAARAGRTPGVAQLVAPAIVAEEAADGGVVAVVGGRSIGHGATVADVIWGAEQGGRARPETMQFQPYRPEGYFLGPSADDAEESIEGLAGDALGDALAEVR